MSPSDRVAQLYPPAKSSLFVAFYDLQATVEVFCPPPHGIHIVHARLIWKFNFFKGYTGIWRQRSALYWRKQRAVRNFQVVSI
jgi:hypothetical protein